MLWLVCALVVQSPLERDLLETKEGAALLSTPRFVAGPWVDQWNLSKDGAYIAAVVLEGGDEEGRHAAEPGTAPSTAAVTKIVVYNLKSSRATTVFESRTARVIHMDWMTGPAFLANIREGARQSIHRWIPGTSYTQELLSAETRVRPLEFQISKQHPYGIAYIGIMTIFGKSWLIKSTGPATELNLPPGPIGFDVSGKIHVMDEATKGVRLIEPSGDFVHSSGWPSKPRWVEPAKGLTIQQLVATIGGQPKIDVKQAWLLDTRMENAIKALVAAESDDARLAPGNGHVAYLTQHNLHVRTLKHLNRLEYQELRDREEQRQLMERARDVARAFHIFAADNQDELPTRERFGEAISPFLKNVGQLQGFAYQLNGGKLDAIRNPSQTVLGYTQGRKGRAVAYADGSVRWEPNK